MNLSENSVIDTIRRHFDIVGGGGGVVLEEASLEL